MTANKDPYELQSVANALSILDLLSQYEELSLAAVSKHMKISPTTAFRLLHTLERYNYVVKSPQARYRLSIKLATFGDIVTRRMDIVRIVHPYLEKLSQQFQETAHLVVWNSRYDVIVADRIIGSSPISYKTAIGFITPAHTAASGRVLLAYTDTEHAEDYIGQADFPLLPNGLRDEQEFRAMLSTIRTSGFAENEGDAIPGLSCYAVPLFGKSGRAVASLSISGPQINLNLHKEEMIVTLRSCAEKINQQFTSN